MGFFGNGPWRRSSAVQVHGDQMAANPWGRVEQQARSAKVAPVLRPIALLDY
jgi:hypothetical protein